MGCRLRGQFRSFGSTEAVPPHGSAKRRVTGRPRVIRRRRILPGAAPPPFLSRQPEAGSAPQSRGPEKKIRKLMQKKHQLFMLLRCPVFHC